MFEPTVIRLEYFPCIHGIEYLRFKLIPLETELELIHRHWSYWSI